jgi:hypothetical protein
MDRDAIERLAIDMAAEELNEDMQALLKEYLAGNHQANEWAEQMLDVFAKTEDAITAKTTDDKVPIAAATGRSEMRWQPVARWAAVIMITATIGFLVGRRFHTPTAEKVTPTTYAVAAAPVRTLADFKERYEDTFWGDKILSSFERTDQLQRSRRISSRSLLHDLDEYLKENKL